MKIKLKSRKSSNKRFFLSRSRKSKNIKRSHSFTSHLANNKKKKRKNHLKKRSNVVKSEISRLISMIK